MKIRTLCECNSRECFKVVEIDDAEFIRYLNAGQVVISRHCLYGAEPTEILVAEFEDYTVYLSNESTKGE